MRFLALVAALTFSLPASAGSESEGIGLVRQLAQVGAPELAASLLDRIPATSPTERQALRVVLAASAPDLVGALSLAERLPDDIDPEIARDAWFAAAHAALALPKPRPELARRYLTRLLWQAGLDATDARRARAMVVDSYLAEDQVPEALPLMQRFRRDFGPLDAATADRWVGALIDRGLAPNAGVLLEDIDPAGPLALQALWETGHVSARQTVAAARQAVAGGNRSKWWQVMRLAARSTDDTSAEVVALEQLVADAGSDGELVADLRSAYRRLALEIGNASQLLAGADLGWSDRAAALESGDPVKARAIWGYLVHAARDQSLRQTAQIRLANLLSGAGVGRTAVALFRDETGPLPRDVRYVLGAWAADADEPVFAARLWKDLDAPPLGVPGREWELRRAIVFLRGGDAEAAVSAVSRALTGGTPLTREQTHRLSQLALDLADAGNVSAAERILRLLVTDAEPFLRRDLLFSLGRLAEMRNDAGEAANLFLQVAVGRGDDAFTQVARIRAAANLAQAGFRRDARRQYEQVLRSASDATHREAARRALAKLGS